ncbi:MAG: hypothetical protein AAGB04_00365 [Pseudomonadota bacterium]
MKICPKCGSGVYRSSKVQIIYACRSRYALYNKRLHRSVACYESEIAALKKQVFPETGNYDPGGLICGEDGG